MGAGPARSLYETDLHAWSLRQAKALAGRNHRALDSENLIEEVESVGCGQRAAVARSPSLRQYPGTILTETYRDAVHGAAQETGLPEDRSPGDVPFTLDEILDPGFEA